VPPARAACFPASAAPASSGQPAGSCSSSRFLRGWGGRCAGRCDRFDRLGSHRRVEPRDEVADERLVAKRRFARGPCLLALATRDGGGRPVVVLADLEREQKLATGGRFERDLELVGVGLVGQMLVRGGNRQRQRVAAYRLELGLRG